MPIEVNTIVLPAAIESDIVLTKISRISVDDGHEINDSCHTKSDNDDNSSVSQEQSDQSSPHITSETFYTDAQKYWHGIAPTVDGMLGGFGSISHTDVRGSNEFLQQIFKMKPAPGRRVALDCGAGIGRVTKNLLIPLFQQVDVVEQCTAFTDALRQYVGTTSKLGEIYAVGLQEFTPESKKYDIIWAQWVLSHLTDDDLIAFFRRCIDGLSRHGVIVIKENVTASDTSDVDVVDSSVTRPLVLLKALIVKSGLRIIKMTRQSNFPAGIFPVYMITLKPAKSN